MKLNLLIIFMIILIVPISFGLMNFNSFVQPVCKGGVCLEGSNALWKVRINNLGNESIAFSKISLRDDKNLVFASKIFKNGEFVLQPKRYQVVDIPGFIPGPTKGSLLYYQVDYLINGKIYSDNIKVSKIMPLSEVECTRHEFCRNDELCIGYKCIPEVLVNTTNMNITRLGKKKTEIRTVDVISIINAFILIGILLVLLKKKR